MRFDVTFGLVALALVSGCTAHVHPKPDLRALDGMKVPMRVAVVISPQMTTRQDPVGSLDGIGGSWVFDTGEIIPPAVTEVAKRVFDASIVVPTARDARDADVIVTVKSFQLARGSARSNDYSVKLDMHAVATKPNGEEIFDEYYSEQIAGNAHSSDTALYVPAENAVTAVMTKLASDLRTRVQPAALAPPPTPAPEVAGAPASGSPDFSAYPPPPPPAGDKESPPPPPPADATAAAAPAAAAPVALSSAPSASTNVTRRIEPPASRGPAPFVMLAAGALLFAGGYVAGPAYLYGAGTPGDNSLSFIPIAGPLLVASGNPFLSTMTSTWVYAIAATAAQGVGLVLAVTGIAAMGRSSGSSGHADNSVIHADSWAVVPTVTPHGGLGVAFVAN